MIGLTQEHTLYSQKLSERPVKAALDRLSARLFLPPQDSKQANEFDSSNCHPGPLCKFRQDFGHGTQRFSSFMPNP